MPIVGLTDRRRSRYPEVGVIRKGEKKPESGNKPGKDLSYFRMDTQDASVQKLWDELYPKEPRELIITLPHRTVEENFSVWKEEWIASGLAHRCDGKFMVQQRDKQGEMVMFSDGDQKPCPGGCSIAGRLSAILPQMRRLSTVMVFTSSKWDVINLTDNLNALYDIKQNLMGIPIILRRVLKSISTPRGNGKRARSKSWLLQLEAAPGYVAAELEYRAHEALPRVHLPAIAAPKARIEPDPTWREWEPEVVAANGEDAPGPVIDVEPVLAEPPQRVVHTEPAEAATVETPPSPTYDRAAFLLRADLAAKIETFQRGYEGGTHDGKATDPATPVQAGLVASLLTEAFAPDENATQEYHSALKFLFKADSAGDLTFCQARAALSWLTTKKNPETGEYPLNDGVSAAARLCVREAMLAAGQAEMAVLGEEE